MESRMMQAAVCVLMLLALPALISSAQMPRVLLQQQQTLSSPAPASPRQRDTSSSPQPAAKSSPGPSSPAAAPSGSSCPEYIDTQKYRTTNFTDYLNTTESISPKRPSANVPTGDWISGRATFYGTDERVEAAHVACGEPAGQYGVVAQGACGYTNSDGSLPFPKEEYTAAADTNDDYPGSCGRCYQVRCKTGSVSNNGRPLRMSDLIYARPYQIKDNFGRDWPGNPKEKEDLVWTQCWDDNKTVTVRVADSCPCKYNITATGEIRTQNWCCGGNNHFDLSFWAFEQLAHPTYGVIPIEYRPVDCETGAPLRPVPGFVNQTIFSDSIQPGWNWLPYDASNAVLLARGQGVEGSTATCAVLSKGGGIKFWCRECARPGYQPFSKAQSLQFDIRSNTKSSDPFASSTPRGELPPLKLFLMNSENGTYCGAEVTLSSGNITTNAANATNVVAAAQYATKSSGDWYSVKIPLSIWACDQGSTGSLSAVDRVDFQNVNERNADVCLDNIKLV